MRPDRIDILLTTYNGERFLERQLESVVVQMESGCRLLIRDDGSSDGTLRIVRRFVARQPDRVSLLDDDSPQLGVCQSFSRLIERSDADYMVLCDQDDVSAAGPNRPVARPHPSGGTRARQVYARAGA